MRSANIKLPKRRVDKSDACISPQPPNSLCVEYMECGGKRSATPL
jgi:hypothetical protein